MTNNLTDKGMSGRNGPCSVKMGLSTFAKSIDPCQSAQSAQADMCRNFSPSLNCCVFQRSYMHHDWLCSAAKWIFMDPYLKDPFFTIIIMMHRGGGPVVRASASLAGGRGFDTRPRQTKVFKTGSSGSLSWCSGLWE